MNFRRGGFLPRIASQNAHTLRRGRGGGIGGGQWKNRENEERQAKKSGEKAESGMTLGLNHAREHRQVNSSARQGAPQEVSAGATVTSMKKPGIFLPLAALCLILACVAPAFSQTAPGAQRFGSASKVEWTARFDPAEARAGDSITLRLRAQIEEGWHLYATELKIRGPVATRLEPKLPEGWALAGAWKSSVEPVEKFDKGFNGIAHYFPGEVEFSAPVVVGAGAPGEMAVEGTAFFQVCTDEMCLPPSRVTWTAPLRLLEGGSAPPPPGPAASPAPPGPRAAEEAAGARDNSLAAAKSRGLIGFLVLALIAGFASLLTPCVFPMVPITVSFFTKRAEKGPRQALYLASVYGAGIVLTFSILGLLLSAILGAFQGLSGAGAAQWIASNPWVNLALAALFVFFALSLFGLFEIQLPTGLTNRLRRAGGGRADTLGALIMAVVFTLTSFTCTVQFVGLLLVEAARGGWLWPGLGMVVYSAAFASPFFLLALFPQAISRLPRGGPWLHTTKVLMGFLELAAAFKFLSNSDLVWEWNLFSRELTLAAWSVIAVFAGLYLLGKIRMAGEPPDEGVGTLRLLFSMGFITLGLYLASGLAGARLHGLIETYLPIRAEAVSLDDGRALEAAENRLVWYDDYEAGLALAKREGRPVFLDFTGVTCTNCRWMELNIFERPEIRALFRNFLLLRLYTDSGARAEFNQRVQIERFETSALPFYAVLSPEGEVIATHGGIERDPARFAAFLRRGAKE